MTHRLEADSIFLEYGNRRVLSDIYIRCDTGQITGLLGRNGQGKTSLMNIIYGSLQVNSSSVRVDGHAVFNLFKQPDKITILSQFNFIPGHLKLKNIFSLAELSWQDFIYWFPGFESFKRFPIRQLSGGQRRIVETYMIICSPALFSLLDEPFTHLMPLEIERIKELIRFKKQGKGFLITDHLYSHILDLSDQLYLLTDGKCRRMQNREEIIKYGYISS